jgi:hypothetical protein
MFASTIVGNCNCASCCRCWSVWNSGSKQQVVDGKYQGLTFCCIASCQRVLDMESLRAVTHLCRQLTLQVYLLHPTQSSGGPLRLMATPCKLDGRHRRLFKAAVARSMTATSTSGMSGHGCCCCCWHVCQAPHEAVQPVGPHDSQRRVIWPSCDLQSCYVRPACCLFGAVATTPRRVQGYTRLPLQD